MGRSNGDCRPWGGAMEELLFTTLLGTPSVDPSEQQNQVSHGRCLQELPQGVTGRALRRSHWPRVGWRSSAISERSRGFRRDEVSFCFESSTQVTRRHLYELAPQSCPDTIPCKGPTKDSDFAVDPCDLSIEADAKEIRQSVKHQTRVSVPST